MRGRVIRGDRVSWFVPWVGYVYGTVTSVDEDGVAVVQCDSHQEMGRVPVAVSKLQVVR